MRIVYMGTPDFAVAPLKALMSRHEVVCAVCQPDKQKGRGKKVVFPPVKEAAVEGGIPVLQPESAKDEDFIEEIKKYEPHLIVVAAFGQLLPEEVLNIPEYGCINIHASLLPKYRGAAPVQYMIINGEKEAGVTTMLMEKGLDTGDILLSSSIPIQVKETYGGLLEKLSKVGAELILKTIELMEEGNLKRMPQNDEESSYAGMITKEMGLMDFVKPADELERLIRGFNPWPGCYTGLHGKTLKIWDADVITLYELKKYDTENIVGRRKVIPGQVVMLLKEGMVAAAGRDFLLIKEVQLEGKKRMDCGAFLRGYEVSEGTILS